MHQNTCHSNIYIYIYSHITIEIPQIPVATFHDFPKPRLDAFQLQELLIHRTALVVLEQIKATIADAFLL